MSRFKKEVFFYMALGLAVAGILIFSRWSIHSFEKLMLTEIDSSLRLSVLSGADNIKEMLSGVSGEMEELARNSQITGFLKSGAPCSYAVDHAALCPAQNNIANFKKHVDALLFFDAQGKLLDRWPDAGAAPGSSASVPPDVVAVVKNRQPLFGQLEPGASGESVLSFAMPVMENGAFLGVAVAQMSLGRLNDFVQNGKSFLRSNFFLVDSQGTLLSHEDKSQLGQNIVSYRRAMYPDFDWHDFERVIAKMASGEEGVDTYRSVWWSEGEAMRPVKKLAVFQPLVFAGQRLSLAVVMDYNDLMAPIKGYSRDIFVGSEFVVLLFLMGGFMLRRERQANFDLSVEAKASREWRETFDAIKDFVSIHESDYKVLRVNKALAKAFGKKPEELVGKSCFELIHGTNGPIVECPHEQTLKTGQPAQEEFFNPYLGLWLEVSTAPIFNDHGRVVRTVHIAKDITPRKKIEEKITRLTKLMDDIIQNAPIGMYVVDHTGYVQYPNKAMLEMSGATLEQTRRLNVLEYEPYVRLGLSEKIRGALRGEPFRMENVMFESIFDGRITTRNMSGIPMIGEDGKALIIFEDVTYKKQIEKVKRLEELGKFVGDTAHFIDNPLMVIMGSAEMSMMESATGDEVKENLRVIVRECERAKNIIRGLRQFAEPAKRELSVVDMRGILEDIAAGLRLEWQQNGIACRVFSPADALPVNVNIEDIKRALLQILLNAKEAMPGGGVVEVRAAREDSKARVDIKDAGPGMNEKVLEHIFDPFYTTVEGKKGLGVSVAYGIIRDHGGDIRYSSEAGRGTTASIFLPLA